jgi:hypothetical protein
LTLRGPIRALLGLGASALIAVSCTVNCKSPSTPASGRTFTIPSSLAPTERFSEKARLTIGPGDLIVPVTVEYKRTGGELVVDLLNFGQSFERELYRTDGNGFFLVEAALENYDPPIMLLKFPLTVGEHWTWKGKVTSGGQVREAEANVTTASEGLLLASGTVDCVLVEVRLKLVGAAVAVPERRLSFWFAPGKGIAQRQFGGGSKRAPAE